MEFKFVENIGRDLRDVVLRLLRDYSEALGLAILMALILRIFVFSAYKISNTTMEPNLKLGDFIIGYKLPYGLNIPFTDQHWGEGRPRRGDMLIFKCPNSSSLSCVKRAVGLAGDRIEIRGKRLIVNGRKSQYEISEERFSPILEDQRKMVVLREKSNKSPRRSVLISESPEGSDFGPIVVPPRTFFALGDNRDFSEDSRHWGPVATSTIEARAVLVWLSIEWHADATGSFSSRLRWERIFSSPD